MSEFPKVVDDTVEQETNPALQALLDEVSLSKRAMEMAKAAPSIEVTVDGKVYTHLQVKLTPAETIRVLALPEEERATMAESILRERFIATWARKAVAHTERKITLDRKRAKRRKNKSKRRNR